MIKITDIEALLNSPLELEVEVKNLKSEDIKELARYYGSYFDETHFFDSTYFKRNNVDITLISEPKEIYGLPTLDFRF